MMAEAGLAALWLAAALAAVQLILAVLGLRRGREQGAELIAGVRPAAIVQGALVAVAMIMLIGVLLTSDMSVRVVVQDSPPITLWGDYHGSLLLWAALLAIAGAAMAVFERRLSEPTLVATLAAQASIALGSYAFLLVSNPFARIDPALADGSGLAPFLRNSALHQPLLYAGYVGLTVALSSAVGALATGQVGLALVRVMRFWVLGAWVFLTLGITAGRYLSSRMLDPVDNTIVENAPLSAWLAATVLLHWVAMSRLRRRRGGMQAVLERIIWPTAAAGLAFAALVVFGGPMGWLPLIGLSLAIGAGVASMMPLAGRWHRAPLLTWGMMVAHLGMAVSLAGMACDAAFTRETLAAVRVGERARVGPFTVVLDGIAPVIGDGWSALQAQLTATAGDRTLRLFPQSRFADARTTSQGTIVTLSPGQLHAALGQPDAEGRWPLRLRWKPFATLIWFGGGLAALGGLLSLVARVRRGRRAG